MFHKILNHFLKDDDRLKFLLHWGRNYENIWELCNKVPEEAISRYFGASCLYANENAEKACIIIRGEPPGYDKRATSATIFQPDNKQRPAALNTSITYNC